jgi:plastocyanin
MKTNFDKINPKKVLGYLMASAMVFFTGSVTAQINHDVDVANFAFTPSSLTIEVGDSVTFTQTSGSHNVNGDLATFPSNPRT